MTQRDRRLDDVEDVLGSDVDSEDADIPDAWIPFVPPWRLGDDLDEIHLFLLKASYGSFDHSRDREWYEKKCT